VGHDTDLTFSSILISLADSQHNMYDKHLYTLLDS